MKYRLAIIKKNDELVGCGGASGASPPSNAQQLSNQCAILVRITKKKQKCLLPLAIILDNLIFQKYYRLLLNL
jgi:hypothetical protein